MFICFSNFFNFVGLFFLFVDHNSGLVGQVSFQMKRTICSPASIYFIGAPGTRMRAHTVPRQ